MQADGQTYFMAESELPGEDKARYDRAASDEAQESLREAIKEADERVREQLEQIQAQRKVRDLTESAFAARYDQPLKDGS
jgi:hypothetical protein